MYSVVVFDRAGGLASEDFHDAGGAITSQTVVVRDKTGRPMNEEIRSPTGALESRSAITYDGSGRLLRQSYFSADGTPSGGCDYVYDESGRIAKRAMRSEYSDGSVRTNEVSYRYNEDGALVEESYSDESLGGIALSIKHAYQDGVRVRSSDYQRGQWLEFLTFYEHDKIGNRVREASYQIPESEYGDSFSKATSPESLPRSFLSSVTAWEYEYYENP